jgi:HEAT repeat protein
VWRRYGEVAFATVFAVAISLEAIPLGVLTWSLASRLVSGRGGPGVAQLAIGAVGSAAVALLLLTSYVLAYQHLSTRHERLAAERRHAWVVRWLRVLDGTEPAPSGHLDRAAVEALVSLRETMRGRDSDLAAELLERHGAVARLERSARRGRLATRLDAITALSNARIPRALATLVDAVGDPNRTVAVAAARAAARTLARTDDLFDRDRGAAALARAMERAALPYGVLEEVIVLSEEAAPSLVDEMLFARSPTAASLRAALDGIGRLKLLVYGEEVLRHLTNGDDEVRAAALRTVSRLGFLPEPSRGAVLAALGDDVDFIRIHAAAAARLLPRPQALAGLSARLGDRSWWVRRAAADSLVALGHRGLAALGEAARSHPDPFGRDMAAQALRDHVPTLVKAVVG